MLRAAHGSHKEIIRNFMEVGHTQFRLDEGFGITRQHVDGCLDVLYIKDMVNEIKNSARSNSCHLFSVSEVQDWKKTW